MPAPNTTDLITVLSQNAEQEKFSVDKFIDQHKYKASRFFGLCASTNTTAMVTQEILVKQLTMPWAVQPHVFILIVIAITYNLAMEMIFNLIEEYWLKKRNIYLSLNEREAIKHILLVIAAVILISQGYYILPVGLLLFSASYFINTSLQLKLSETIEKLFFTKDENGIARWLEGYKEFEIEIGDKKKIVTLSNQQLMMINAGCVLSMFYVVAVIGVFAKWVLPLILALETSWLVIPLMITASVILLVYGIIYGFLAAKGWAMLVTKDAELKAEHGNGLFSITALQLFIGKIGKGCAAYWDAFKVSINYFGCNLLALLFVPNIKIKLSALLTLIGLIILAAAEVVFLSIKMLQVLIVVAFFPVLTAVQSILESGGTTVGDFMGNDATGQVISYGSFIGYLPFIVRSCVDTIMPEEKKPQGHQTNASQNKISQTDELDFYAAFHHLWLKCLQVCNALTNAGLANDGQIPNDQAEVVKVSGASAVSYTAGGVALNNFMDANQEQSSKRSLTQTLHLWAFRNTQTHHETHSSTPSHLSISHEITF